MTAQPDPSAVHRRMWKITMTFPDPQPKPEELTTYVYAASGFKAVEVAKLNHSNALTFEAHLVRT